VSNHSGGQRVAKQREPLIRIEPGFESRWPGASALASELLINIEYTRQRSVAYLQEVVRKHGISSLTAFNVLAIVEGAGEPLLPSIIAERMVMSRGTITEILDTLERRRLVRRLPHEEDRRMRLVEVTPEGVARLEAVRPEFHQAEQRLVRTLTKTQQRQMLQLVAALQADLPQP
jgi:DNA-binding MarR family transcriptional regulator